MPYRCLAWLLGSLVLVPSLPCQNTTRTYQATAGAPAEHRTRSVTIRVSNAVGSSLSWVTESDRLELRTNTGISLVDFPNVVGDGAGSIPPGATIISARLELWCNGVSGSIWQVRNLTCAPIVDFDRLGTWHEPEISGSEQLQAGVHWLRRDGRPHVDIPWGATGEPGPTSIRDFPVLLGAYPGLSDTIQVDPRAAAGTFQTNQWHPFDVTDAVQFWAHGVANQGFMLTSDSFESVFYGSDDHANPAVRPRLVVTYVTNSGGAPINRVPRLIPPANTTTPAGVDLTLSLLAVDPDGTAPWYRLLEPPMHGTVVGTLPYLTYRPDPGYAGSDRLSYTAYDGLSVAFPATVDIQVTAPAGTQLLTLQEGVSGGTAAVTHSADVIPTLWTGGQRTYHEVVSRPRDGGRVGFLSFPNLVGSGASQVPSGSQVLSAHLVLRTKTINAAGTDERTLRFERIVDPLDRGTSWHEPALQAINTAGCVDCGVSWLYPDARTPTPWYQPGGDIDPADVSSTLFLPSDPYVTEKTVDVTNQVRAWVRGEPNLGWRVTNSSSNAVHLWMEEAGTAAASGEGTASDRPRLLITYRPATASPLSGIHAPRADAGPDQVVYARQAVTLDGSRTTHPTGLPWGDFWMQTGGPSVVLVNPASRTTTFQAPATSSTTHLEFLYVAFHGALWSLDTVRVEVRPQPGGASIPSPSVDAGPDRTIPELTQTTLAGSASGGAGPLAFQWTKVSGPPLALTGAQTLSPSFFALAVGPGGARFVFDFAVTDAGVPAGMTSVVHDTVVITIANTANGAPVPHAGANATAEEGTWFVLDASASTDPEGQPLTFSWSQLLGPAVGLNQYVNQGTAAAVRTPFRIPSVASNTTLRFRVQVSDGELMSAANVDIAVTATLPEFAGSITSNPLGAYRNSLTAAEACHIRRRLGEGWHPTDVAATRALGLQGTVAAALTVVPEPHVETEIFNNAVNLAGTYNVPPILWTPGVDVYPQLSEPQLTSHWLVHALRSQNALRERLVRLFHDRFAANGIGASMGSRHWGVLYADMLRYGAATGTGVLGNYRDLLHDLVEDALILSFINGFDNVAQQPNENFAREFMELHTLGVFDPSGARIYSENDVRAVARAFTGFRSTCFPGPGGSCYTRFDPSFHDNGTKRLFETSPGTFAFSGNYDSHDIVNVVLSHAMGVTASRWLARGLLEGFVLPNPPQSLVDATAAMILSHNWEMTPIMDTLLRSRAMFAPESRKSIVKSPVDLAIGVAKTVRIPLQTFDICGYSGLQVQLDNLGHSLGRPEDVDGWPKDALWLSGYGDIRRADICRRLLILARTPSPVTHTGTLTYPNYSGFGSPGAAPTPVNPVWMYPPARARRAPETLGRVLEILDVDLRLTPAPGASTSEWDIVLYLMNSHPYSGAIIPFNGDDPSLQNKLWEVILLVMQHPEFQRL